MDLASRISNHRAAIHALVDRHHAANPRLFGSVAHGRTTTSSDIDILVDALPEATLFDLGGLQDALEDLLGAPVDLVTPGDIVASLRATIIEDARPL